jgi:hypothetical protein
MSDQIATLTRTHESSAEILKTGDGTYEYVIISRGKLVHSFGRVSRDELGAFVGAVRAELEGEK